MDQVEHGWALLQHPGSDCQRGLVVLGTTVANPDDDASGRSGIPQLSCGCAAASGSSAAAVESLGLTSRSEGESSAIRPPSPRRPMILRPRS